MKKVLILIMLVISTSAVGQVQSIMISTINPLRTPINLNLPNSSLSYRNETRVGPAMMLGGAGFILASVLTPPIMVGGSTTQEKPFFQQGGKSFAMITGCIVLTGWQLHLQFLYKNCV